MLKTVVLVGMMGSGKTSVGKELAKSLNLDFIDVDHEIEKKCKKTIPEIFKKKGEKYFRNIEEKMCNKIINNDVKIISLGGGAFANEKIRKKIKKHALSVWINVGIESLCLRLEKSKNKRPLLDYTNLKKSIKDILDKRKKIYEKADFVVNVKSDNKKKVAEKIMKIL